jgi:hypothetical protein
MQTAEILLIGITNNSFFVRLKRRFLVPACRIKKLRAERRSRMAFKATALARREASLTVVSTERPSIRLGAYGWPP